MFNYNFNLKRLLQAPKKKERAQRTRGGGGGCTLAFAILVSILVGELLKKDWHLSVFRMGECQFPDLATALH